MTSHSFRHFCKPPHAHTPILAATERQGQLPTTPSQELGRFFQSTVMTETNRTQLFLGVSCQVCLCSVRIVVYEMVNQHCVWDSAHHLPSHFPMGHHLPSLPWALHRAPSPRSSDLSPAWALQDLPWLLSSSPGARLTLLHPTVPAQHLPGTAAGLHNSRWDKSALRAQSKCISPHCWPDFACSHWRHRGSQEAVCCKGKFHYLRGVNHRIVSIKGIETAPVLE